MDREQDLRMAITVATSFLGASFPSFVPGSEIPAAVASAALNEGLQRTVEAVRLRRARSTVHAVEAASAEAGVDALELLERVMADDRLLLAFRDVMEAAERTEWDAKVVALGRALGRMARDPAEVDANLVWIDILKQIDRTHLRILQTAIELQQWRSVRPSIEAITKHSGLGHTASPLISVLVSLSLLGAPGGAGYLAKELYELLDVPLPEPNPIAEVMSVDAAPFRVSVATEPDGFEVRRVRDVNFLRTQIWITIWRGGKSGDHDVVFAPGEDSVGFVEASAAAKQDRWRLTWFADGRKFETPIIEVVSEPSPPGV